MAGAASVVVLACLAVANVWPFDAGHVPLGADSSIAEVALGDRLTIGLIRTGVLAVIGYLVVSVPALVLERRWIQGMTTSGLTADVDRRWKDQIEARVAELLAVESHQATRLARRVESEVSERLLTDEGIDDED